jgi:tetratricopeptide (TPR) repeat protein
MATKPLKRRSEQPRQTAPAKRADHSAKEKVAKRKSARSEHSKSFFPKALPSATLRTMKRIPMPVDERHVEAVRSFEAGLQLERRQNYRKARETFERLVAAGPADVADRARVHLRACVERMATKVPSPRTAGEYHVLGVAELNIGDFDRAVEHLSKARKLEPKREEICYALAAAHALRGDREAALEHLEAAITLRPQNRFQARHDADFQPLAADPRFLSLISAYSSEGNGSYRSRL